jgi:hypothetical protein
MTDNLRCEFTKTELRVWSSIFVQQSGAVVVAEHGPVEFLAGLEGIPYIRRYPGA